MIELGQTVTFEGTHFGIRQRLTVKVVEFDRPRLFVDEMTEGPFKSCRHVHELMNERGGTLMHDTIEWASPLGPLGRIFDKLVLERHLRQIVSTRNAALRRLAEQAGEHSE
jgi:ligand-binding SRPBCC domain-containing protein